MGGSGRWQWSSWQSHRDTGVRHVLYSYLLTYCVSLITSDELCEVLYTNACMINCRTGARQVLEVLHMFCGIMQPKISIVLALKEW